MTNQTPITKKQSSHASGKAIKETLALAGAWSDLDFEEMLNTLDHIRHDSKPTPPFSFGWPGVIRGSQEAESGVIQPVLTQTTKACIQTLICYNSPTMSKYITSDPNILSGMPVVTGTRVPVARILSLLKEGYTLEEIHKQFDHIGINTLEGTLAEVATMINNTPHGTQSI
jgi:uncharacterized protein (DUF433 family)